VAIEIASGSFVGSMLCSLHDGLHRLHAGINFNDGFGGGDELAWNLVFSTCRNSGDHGPFNS
jgi:hypothetical protein